MLANLFFVRRRTERHLHISFYPGANEMEKFSSIEYFPATRLTNSTRYKTRIHNVQANFGANFCCFAVSLLAARSLNKFSVEIYLVLFRKLPNFTLKLTPHNLQKSPTLSSLAFLPLTGFAGSEYLHSILSIHGERSPCAQ